MNKAIRHGEALLKPVTQIPEGKLEKVSSCIIAHSETGHHHVLESTRPYTVTKDKMNRLWLELTAEADLVHQKTFDAHSTLTVPPGLYEVVSKTEYNPFTKLIQRVTD
jgi:hypothetical protein